MADKKISDLTAGSTIGGTEELPIVQSSSTVKTTINAIKTFFDTIFAAIASPTFTGTVTTPAIIVSSETASRVAIIDASKNVKSADTATYPSLTELSYAKGVTSAIQTQLDSKSFLTQLLTTATFNPADATTYYFGINLVGYSVLTVQNARRCYINRTGTITAATISAVRAGGAVTSEKSTFNVHVNGGGANQITSNFDFSTSTAEFLNVTGLSISVTSGDYIEIGMVTPTWVTNPTTVSINVQLTIK